MRTPDSNIVVIHVKLIWSMNWRALLSLLILIGLLLLSSPDVYPDKICKKCVDRDFTLFTVGYEFNSGDEIIVRLLNLGDRDVEINYLDLYIVYPGNESGYIGRFEVNSLLKVGSYFEFTIKAPKVEKETTVHLVAFLGIGDKVVSNELTIRPSDTFKVDLNFLDDILTIVAVVLVGYIAYRYYFRG